MSGITGSGLDIFSFAVLVLAFRISEKVATPTSVILMGMNALFGFLWKEGVGAGMAPAAWSFWYVCIPIVVLGAPLGAWFIKNRSRYFVAGFLYLSIVVQYIAAVVIIPMHAHLVLFSAIVVGVGTLVFFGLSHYGENRLLRYKVRPVVHAGL